MASATEALRAVPLFASLSDKALKELAKSMTERTFQEGASIMSEEEGGIGFFVIADGTAAVSTRGDVVSRLGPGDHFGEIALISGDKRIASITAETNLRCFVMSAWSFRPFVRANPDVAWVLLETIVARLRETRTV